MINDFINSIAAEIKAFDADAVIYSEYIPQFFKTPCYYIHTINHNQQLMTAGRRKLTTYQVIYLATENGDSVNEELNRAVELLVEKLCMVEHNGKLYKATDVSTEKVDEGVHYIASYNYNTLYEKGDKMQVLKIGQEAN